MTTKQLQTDKDYQKDILGNNKMATEAQRHLHKGTRQAERVKKRPQTAEREKTRIKQHDARNQ